MAQSHKIKISEKLEMLSDLLRLKAWVFFFFPKNRKISWIFTFFFFLKKFPFFCREKFKFYHQKNLGTWNIPKYSLLFFTTFFDLEEIIFEIFNIFENNIINFELAKVPGLCIYTHICTLYVLYLLSQLSMKACGAKIGGA